MRLIATALLLSIPYAMALAQSAGAPPAYRVIVHPQNPVTAIERRFVAEAFLKKVIRWQHGEALRPVDLRDSAPRRTFSEEVLARPVSAVRSYWQQQIFSGRNVPPPELDSDGDVVRFVLRNPGAIGYVSGHAELGSAKVLELR